MLAGRARRADGALARADRAGRRAASGVAPVRRPQLRRLFAICPRCYAAINGGRAATGPRAGRGFWRGRGGSVALEGAIAISILVAAFAGLMAIVQDRFATDRLARAAHAAARSLALDRGADVCGAIRRELGLAADFDCDERWLVTVERGVRPSALADALRKGTSVGGPEGEMVLVRIAWPPSDSPDAAEVPMAALGLARREEEAG